MKPKTQEHAFPFEQFEPKWQEIWQKEKTFSVANPTEPNFNPHKKKIYILDMFPYPSGDGLHVGHPEGYTASDIYTRYMRRKGFQVLHPMGWDAFGLPAEQYAIKTGQHPKITTDKNIAKFKEQLKKIGFSYDWQREINTTDPKYYRWTQWIFLKLYNSYYDKEQKTARPITELKNKGLSKKEIDAKRLAYISEEPVNWCPALGTVLANEEVIDGKSERGNHPVERRNMRQWMLRITDYAERLLEGLDDLDWPTGVKLLQTNWIGRSEGAQVIFRESKTNETIEIFTTRPDTLFGATYMVLSPEHKLVKKITTDKYRQKVEKHCQKIATKSELERTDLAKEKTGVFTGAYALNPVNNEKIPIWIADYVLASYGTGAIMAVPAHDERDFEFAKKFELKIVEVVKPKFAKKNSDENCFAGEGIAINSPLINDLPTSEAKEKIISWLEKNKLGTRKVNYKLRDWLFSRQRYWGEPFPIKWDKESHLALDESELPVELPNITDFKPSGKADPPLSKAKEWVNNEKGFRKETNTMPQWAGSCWYYLRFCDPQNQECFIGKSAEEYWAGKGNGLSGMVDLYIGGTEHAVLHLLYARFWHKVLFDLGYVSKPEPFQKLVNQGMILGEDGQKMSKSRGNVINPDDVIENFGADSLRLFEMFMGPLEQTKPWSTKGIQGVHRFLARVWRLVYQQNNSNKEKPEISARIVLDKCASETEKILHESIKKISEDIEKLNFNTAISQLMVLTNHLTNLEKIPLTALLNLLSLLEPFAPHIAEELNRVLIKKFNNDDKCIKLEQLSRQDWLEWDSSVLAESFVKIIVQVNAKVRDNFEISSGADEATVLAKAKKRDKVIKNIGDKKIIKTIFIPNKLLNIVISK